VRRHAHEARIEPARGRDDGRRGVALVGQVRGHIADGPAQLVDKALVPPRLGALHVAHHDVQRGAEALRQQLGGRECPLGLFGAVEGDEHGREARIDRRHPRPG
jgi:hypothetical protein